MAATAIARTRVEARGVSAEKVVLAGLLLTVFSSQMAFALWANGEGYLWGDAISRASAALIALHGADPHLAAIGFVWMPLPTLLELVPAAVYPRWPGVVESGLASSLITVLAGTLTAAIVFATARRLELSMALASAYALLVSFSPMLFLFSTNGMSEGVAAPFLVGSVCCLLLFWQSGQRRYVAVGGLMLALAFACLYQAVHFGAAMTAALGLGLFTAENAPSAPQGRLRAAQGLSLLFLVPSAYVGVLWVIANAAIMDDPLYFATSIYSNEGYISSSGTGRLSDAVIGDVAGSIEFVVVRTVPFFIPIAAIYLVRLMEGRLLRLNTLTLTAIALVVPFGLILPQLYDGNSFGWLRYFIYPLYVAAGWGLYEIATSRRRHVATAIVLAGWVLSIPASLVVMNNPEMGQNEYQVLRAVRSGEPASAVGYPMYFEDVLGVSAAIDGLPDDAVVLADASNAWTIAATVEPRTLKHNLLFTSDARFKDALRDPAANGVDYVLVPDPSVAPQDLLNTEHPGLWEGAAPGFTLAQAFDETGVGWRLYRVDR